MLKTSTVFLSALFIVVSVGCGNSNSDPSEYQSKESPTQSFKRYMKRVKVSEAKIKLRSLTHSIREYHFEERIDPRKSVRSIAHLLPAENVGPTPPIGSCCKQKGKKCNPPCNVIFNSQINPVMFLFRKHSHGPG